MIKDQTPSTFYNHEAENGLLGAILTDPGTIDQVKNILKPADFHLAHKGTIYAVILALHAEGKIPDPILLHERLATAGKLEPDPAELIEIMDNRPMAHNALEYARIVGEKADKRRLWLASQAFMTDLLNGKYDGMAGDLVREIQIARLQEAVDAPVAAKPATWADLEDVIGPVEWAWKGWLPCGLLTILAGESGAGKSALALRLCATFLRGDLWPDGTRCPGGRGAVLWCEAEAAQAVNLERAQAWGLPVDKILTPFDDPLRDVKIDNPQHQRAIAHTLRREDVRFAVVDSLSGASTKDENSSEAMAAVLWLAALARDTGKPIKLLHHLRKRGILDGEQRPNLERLRGYSGIVQPARMIWALDTPNPNNEDVKRLSVIKSNLARFPEPLGLQVTESGVTFCNAPEPPKIVTALDQAIEALRNLLASEPMPFGDIMAELQAMGIAERTARRAKNKLGIVSTKEGNTWKWGLPHQDN